MRIGATFILICLIIFWAVNIYAQGNNYPWNDPKILSGELYGRTVTVEGKVSSVYNFVRAAFIYFGDPNQDFMAVIYRPAFGEFDYKINEYFEGKRVRITGLLEESKGQPVIIIKMKSQVEVLDQKKEDSPPGGKYE